MSDYSKSTNFAAKDDLPTGSAGKIIKGSEIDVEFNAIEVAVLSKADTASPTFTGTPTVSGSTPAGTTNTTQIATTAFVQAAITAAKQALYPVGSIYVNATNSLSPDDATLLGFGSWSPFGEGRVAVGAGTGGGATYTATATGGSKDAVVVNHTHTFSGTTNDPGNHTHNVAGPYGGGGNPGGSLNVDNPSGATYTTTAAGAHTHTVSGTTANSGSSDGTNANMQPYVVVYMWRRTA